MKAKRFTLALLCAALIFALLPAASLADGAYSGLTVSGGAEGTDYAYDGGAGTLTILTGRALTLSGTSATRIVVQPGVAANLTLSGANIDVSATDGACAFDMAGAVVNLTLLGSNTLISDSYTAGLHCPDGATLTITGTGSLTAAAENNGFAGGGNGAGIGGDDSEDCGTIIIESGTVTAIGYNCAAGIGGSDYRRGGGTVIIHGGTVTAIGGEEAAGIGGGKHGNGGNVTILGGTVTAIGGAGIYSSGGAGIGGGCANDGFRPTLGGAGGTVDISGGVVFAFGGGSGEDIGHGAGISDNSGALSISGTAAVFLKNDRYPAATTAAAHTKYSLTNAAAGDAQYGISVPWDGSFSAYLRLYNLDYNLNGGSGTLPASITQHAGPVMIAGGSGLSRANYAFAGWNTQPGGGGSSYAAGEASAFTGDTTLYAQWREYVPIAGLPLSRTLYVGERLTWDPQPRGGVWEWNKEYFSADLKGPVTFTALRPGTSVVTYSAGGAMQRIIVTIYEFEVPQTGDAATPSSVIAIGLAALCGISAAALNVPAKKRKTKA
ncbi:MAG: InlB B-repeat-containing protein [Bacillota bacterium]